MADIRRIEELLRDIREEIERNVLEDMDDFQQDFEDLINDELQDGRAYRKKMEQIITDLEDGLIGKIKDTKENLDDPDVISENIDRIYDLMTMVRKEIEELRESIHQEFEAGEFSDQREGEEVFDAIKGVLKNFNAVFEDFEDAYYNDEFTLDM